MRTLFVDTAYWLGLLNPEDPIREKCLRVSQGLVDARFVTSQMVLVELLNALSKKGTFLRKAGVQAVEFMESDPRIEVVPQNAALFQLAIERYRDRSDKSWSLTDCASFVIMENERIAEALIYDRHFQ